MRRSMIALCAAVHLAAPLAAEPPPVEWTRTYGGAHGEECTSGQQTSDNGFILTGDTDSFGDSLHGDIYLVKADSMGNLQWQRTFGSPNGAEHGAFVQQTTDNGYIIAGWAGGAGSLLLKTDSLGNLQWQRLYATDSPPQYLMCVRQTADGGYVASGGRMAALQYADLYLLRTGSSGESLWTKSFSDYGEGSSVIVAGDGGYVITGLYEPPSAETAAFYENRKLYLMKTDSMGNQEWRQTYPNNGVNVGSAVLLAPDGGYVVAGEGRSLVPGNSMDVLLMKTDAQGNLVWKKTYGGEKWDGARGQCVGQTADGGYIVGGRTKSLEKRGGAFYLVRTDSAANPQWQRVFDGDSPNNRPSFVLQASDGGYVVGGTLYDPETEDINFAVFKLWPDGAGPDKGQGGRLR